MHTDKLTIAETGGPTRSTLLNADQPADSDPEECSNDYDSSSANIMPPVQVDDHEEAQCNIAST